MKRLAYIIAYKNFRDEEYFIPKEILEGLGFGVDTYSSKGGVAIGSEGAQVETESLESIRVNSYEGIVLAGGEGALKYLDSEAVYSLLNEFDQKGKIVSAICISPVILAKAGLLKDKKATVWSSNMNKSAIKTFKSLGVDYVDSPVVLDGRIITANGPEAAKEFGVKISTTLEVK